MNKTIKNFLSAASGNLLGQIIAFLANAYFTRTLGPDGYGIINFAQSFIMYFFITSDLGISLYCIREVNKGSKDSSNEESKINTLFTIKFYLSLFSMIVFSIIVFFMDRGFIEKLVLYGFSISIFFSGVSIDFLFTAKQNMKYSGIAAILKNLIWLLLSIVFVKSISNIVYVSVFYTLGVTVSAIYLITKFGLIYKRVRIVKFSKDWIHLIREALPLSLSVFMIQINNNFDVIYLGFKRSKIEVGYYSAAYKMINFLIAILVVYLNSSYGSIAELFTKDKNKLSTYINKFFKAGIFFVTPVVVGGNILSDKIMVFLYGTEFNSAGSYFSILIFLIYIRMITSTFGAVLIMGDKSKKFSNGVLIGASINIILNICLIPKYGPTVAAFNTLICESVQGIYFYYYYRKDCKTNFLLFMVKPLIGSFVMGAILYKFDLSLVVSILIGVPIYFAIMAVLNINNYLRVKRTIR